MAAKRTPARQRELNDLLTRDHTLNGAILFGVDGHIVEMQARAMEVLRKPLPLAHVTKISGMAREGVKESLDRIGEAATRRESSERNRQSCAARSSQRPTWLDLPLPHLRASGSDLG